MLYKEPHEGCGRGKKIPWRSCTLILLLLFICACGRKAPPILPQLSPLPQVIGFKSIVEDNLVEFSWRLGPKEAFSNQQIESFHLYQAILAADESDCVNCPKTFKPIAEIPLTPFQKLSDGSIQWRYRMSFDKEYRYFFKINISFSDGRLGPDSKVMELKD
ncbi:MAG: hypothetical protein PVI90_09945 [Desulfobacteraceae bacterium]|jgi:hypothetical protein